jgi:hypothetical protein
MGLVGYFPESIAALEPYTAMSIVLPLIPWETQPRESTACSLWEISMKYHHLGIPTTGSFANEIDIPHLKMTVSDHRGNAFGIQWQRYWPDAPYPELVKSVPHVAFEVGNLARALEGQEVIISPNSPSPGFMVAFIVVDGAPVELLEIDRSLASPADV